MPCTSILPCHGAIRLEFSLSGSVGPFASLMIALMPCTRMWEHLLPVACFLCFFGPSKGPLYNSANASCHGAVTI